MATIDKNGDFSGLVTEELKPGYTEEENEEYDKKIKEELKRDMFKRLFKDLIDDPENK